MLAALAVSLCFRFHSSCRSMHIVSTAICVSHSKPVHDMTQCMRHTCCCGLSWCTRIHLPSEYAPCMMHDRTQGLGEHLAGLLLQGEGALLGHEGPQLALPLLNLPLPRRLLHHQYNLLSCLSTHSFTLSRIHSLFHAFIH